MKTMMNRLSGAALLFVLMLGSAWAGTVTDTNGGTIEFSGTLTSNSCTVALDDKVDMPKIPTSRLQTAGSTAGRIQFTITLSGCLITGGDGPVQIGFRNGINIDQTTGNLKEKTDTTHVQIRLLNSKQQVINLVDNTNSEQLTTAGASASFTLYAEYYAPAAPAVTVGSVTAALPFDIIYP